METEENYVAFVLCILCIVILRRRLSTRYRHVWSRDWLLRRQQHSAYHALLQELDREDPGKYVNYLRINKETFDISFSSIRSMSIDVTVSVQIKYAMKSSCSNISPPNIGHVLLFTMLLPEILLLLNGYLMASFDKLSLKVA